ncbi:MAG: hypothetical protein JJU00_13325 [Opitutales bacterium]|nr:hypothetical protein [Opitutales bacterium]
MPKKPKKQKKKLTPEQRRAKKRRKEEFQTIFINGKQKRIRREPMVEGLPADEFIRRNADPVWLHQNEMWKDLESTEPPAENRRSSRSTSHKPDDGDLPF